jgi:predicted N-acetyltransferase YhbS
VTPPVRYHAADDAQRLAAFANVFDVWPMADTLEEHIARRQQSVQHRYARWYVGTRGTEVVVSLACYPMQFAVHGEIVPGIAIGSVHTRADCRGQRLAPGLLQHVEREAAQHGARLSLLYSDIGTKYYARLGYQACPSWEVADSADPPCHRPSPAADAVRSDQPPQASTPRLQDATWPSQPHRFPSEPPTACTLRLQTCDPRAHSAELRRWYAEYHGALALCVVRDAAYWEHLLQRRAADRWFWLCDASGAPWGYLRCTLAGDRVRISDYALCNDDEASFRRLCQAVRAALGGLLPPRLGGWLPQRPATREYFALRPRAREITMLKPLDDRLCLDDAARQAANYFCEIDHV